MGDLWVAASEYLVALDNVRAAESAKVAWNVDALRSREAVVRQTEATLSVAEGRLRDAVRLLAEEARRGR